MRDDFDFENFKAQALGQMRCGSPEIINSDQGSQYTSAAWTGYLQTPGEQIRISMDGRGRATTTTFGGTVRLATCRHI